MTAVTAVRGVPADPDGVAELDEAIVTLSMQAYEIASRMNEVVNDCREGDWCNDAGTLAELCSVLMNLAEVKRVLLDAEVRS